MITGSTLLSLLVTLVVVGLIAWLCWWFIDFCGLPEPFNKVAKVLVALVVLIFLINMLLGFGGGTPLIRWR